MISGRRPRAAWLTALLPAALAAGLLTSAPAHAVVGDPAADGAYAFTVKVDIGDGKRSCSGALVDQRWVMTAAGCFADGTAKPTAGAPKLKTTVTVGRTDLGTDKGRTVAVTELLTRDDRDVVLAELAEPVTDVAPVAIGAAAPAQGEVLRVAGYGRTKDEWVPSRLHSATFTVASVQGTTIGLAAKAPADASVCKGDSGGPAFREKDGRAELAAISTASWQTGCLGSTETRKGVTETRVDDLGPWVRQARLKTASLMNDFSKRCLVVSWRTPDNGGPATQYDCNPAYADQVWELESVATGGYQIRNSLSKRCLVVYANGQDNGSPAAQHDCNPAWADQVWDLVPVATGGYQIRNAHSKRCLVVFSRDSENGSPAAQYDCNPAWADQVWKI
ncbi:trypsin-like serine protease [Streptomyces sp. NPDC037389]|uniref:trypsin-like serine protease n=1 Tax=Streptomyces sp. NPDC037389 TaxID=3155369 RepID=UPI0034064839